MTGTCEHRQDFRAACAHPAVFLIQVGTRKSDAQRSCGVHLARTCMVMAYGDGGLDEGPKTLTVTMTGVI